MRRLMRSWRHLVGAFTAALALAGATAAPAAATTYPVSYNFLNAVVAATSPGTPPLGSDDWNCKPSAAHPEPVVLVHGLFANQTDNWQTISPLLANQGYCVFSLTYGDRPDLPLPLNQFGGIKPMEESAAQLGAFVDQVLARTGAAKVDIVGHSEGSLMPDYYVKFLGGAAKVDKYVGLTTLWHGTNPAGLADLNDLGAQLGGSSAVSALIDPYCGSCRQFLRGSDFTKKLNEGGTAAVPGVTYTSVITRYDELVNPYTSGVLEPGPNVTNIVLQDQCATDYADHVAVAADPVAARDILNALDPATAQPVPCTLVLPGIGAPTYSG